MGHVPKRVIQEEQVQASILLMYGQATPQQAWLSAMVNLKRRYYAAHKQAVDFGFIRD